MLRYRGTGLFYTLEGQCQDESVYTVGASVSFADQHSVLFAEEKMFGNDFSLWRSIQFALIRNVLLGVNQILVEELHPVVDELADFSSEEKEVLDFVRQFVTQNLIKLRVVQVLKPDRFHTLFLPHISGAWQGVLSFKEKQPTFSFSVEHEFRFFNFLKFNKVNCKTFCLGKQDCIVMLQAATIAYILLRFQFRAAILRNIKDFTHQCCGKSRSDCERYRKMYYNRALNIRAALEKKSILLLGPRRTGKSQLIANEVKPGLCINLLHSEEFQRFTARPGLIRELIGEKKVIAIDEIQKVPELMDEVHSLIESSPSTRFLLTGSSARKLKKSHTSLMAGRLRTYHLHPFVTSELYTVSSSSTHAYAEFENFFAQRLQSGFLPPVVTSQDPQEELSDYAGDYLREEIAQEGWVRNVGPFARFLQFAAACQAQLLNFEKTASDAQIPARTIREYFHILEDTLLGKLLPPYQSQGKRKPITKAKFYFFDIGVCHSLLGVKALPSAGALIGTAFESALFQELAAFLDYRKDTRPLCHWRTQDKHEVDFVIGSDVAIEVKYTQNVTDRDLVGLRALGNEAKINRKLIVSRDPYHRQIGEIESMHVCKFLGELWQDKIL